MGINFTKSELDEVLIIEPQIFKDERGFFLETFHSEKYKEMGITAPFVQDNHSYSNMGTLRGLHYQLKQPQGKLIYVPKGRIYDIAVDIRKGSKNFGKHFGIELSDKDMRQLYIPPGFAHGFCVLSESAHVIYKCTALYAPGDDYSLLWSDPTLKISWPTETPTLSDKDAIAPKLSEIPDNQLPSFLTLL